MNLTHDPRLRSWVDSANGHLAFPVQNLPHGVFRRQGSDERWRGGVAIGDDVLDLQAAVALGVFAPSARVAAHAAAEPSLNALMALGPPAWGLLRAELSRLLRHGAAEAVALRRCLVPQAAIELALPARIGDYTDFFTSENHMLNAGRVFRPDAPPLPNFKWLPIAYHGRASSVEVSGASFHRPRGQWREPGEAVPRYAPSRSVDYELELGFWIGPGNARGEPIPATQAEAHVFGVCLLNDWSARDVQAWEAVPLGPFLSKNFLTTVSPWIVTLEALAPFRCALPHRDSDPPFTENLRLPIDAAGFDMAIEAWLQPAMGSASRLSHSNFRHCHWAVAQMVAHHTEGGCNLRPGDLIGSGTQSGPADGEQGCLLELTHGGQRPLHLPDGTVRTYLEDGDSVILRAWCEGAGAARIGFGECRGTLLPCTHSEPSQGDQDIP